MGKKINRKNDNYKYFYNKLYKIYLPDSSKTKAGILIKLKTRRCW